MPSLRSSIRKRLEAEEAEPVEAKEAESDPVEQAENPDNPVEAAAAEAVQKKLDEQPSPVVEPKQPRYEEEEDEDFTDGVRELQWRAADAAAQIQGHKFGSRGYADAIANNLRQRRLTTQRARFSERDGTGEPVIAFMVERSDDTKQNGIDRRRSGLLS